jgi:hypothetical protein
MASDQAVSSNTNQTLGNRRIAGARGAARRGQIPVILRAGCYDDQRLESPPAYRVGARRHLYQSIEIQAFFMSVDRMAGV